ncbi:MAG: hypothetical protein HC802_05035 [Caldilineaceae bacterium]|nr:hypothetical protein [Caldilineaceae bacterium]
MTDRLEIHLLGGVQIALNGAAQPHFISSKIPALMAYLAVTGRVHQRDALAALLWGEMPDSAAANNLRQALTNLRKHFDRSLLITRETVAFNQDAPWFVDAHLFEARVRSSTDKPTEERVALLRQALALYRGDFMEGFFVRDSPDFEDWLLVQRVRLREVALQGWGVLTELLLDSGDYDAAVETAGCLLSMDPWREEAHRQRMLALARSGQSSAALAQFQSCRAVLRQEFGVEPSAETSALDERIRAARHGPRHSLPAATSEFVGREQELNAIQRRLASPACRLLTLVGLGGCGKTRLALQAGGALAQAFLNGVWFVSLAAVHPGDTEAFLTTMATSLALAPGSDDLRDRLIRHLRPLESLIILDNLEHLLDEVAWLSDLLVAAPDLKILATSRERLDLQAEEIMQVHGLPVPPDDTSAPETFAAVRLFAARAQRVEESFRLSEANAPAITQICRLVGALPLGIELAAVWVHQLSCAEIAQSIAQDIDFLATRRRDVSPRQRSLRAAFEHSWRLLGADEQQAFAHLSVFRGPLYARRRPKTWPTWGCLPSLPWWTSRCWTGTRAVVMDCTRRFATLRKNNWPRLATRTPCAIATATTMRTCWPSRPNDSRGRSRRRRSHWLGPRSTTCAARGRRRLPCAGSTRSTWRWKGFITFI